MAIQGHSRSHISKSVQSRPRRRRLEVFTTDAKLIRLTRRRVAFFPTAAARQLFDGDYDAADFKNFPGVIPRISDPVGSSEKGGEAPR